MYALFFIGSWINHKDPFRDFRSYGIDFADVERGERTENSQLMAKISPHFFTFFFILFILGAWEGDFGRNFSRKTCIDKFLYQFYIILFEFYLPKHLKSRFKYEFCGFVPNWKMSNFLILISILDCFKWIFQPRTPVIYKTWFSTKNHLFLPFRFPKWFMDYFTPGIQILSICIVGLLLLNFSHSW